MITSDRMNLLEALGFGSDIDALESYVAMLQDAAALGKPMLTDTEYDIRKGLLEELKPESEVIKRNWELDDNDLNENDEILQKYGMCSIRTITKMTELSKFKDALGNKTVDMLASIKLNGHAVRAVYMYGRLVGGSTRGRYKKGRDISRHLKAILPNYIEEWSQYRLVEIRAELLVSYENFQPYAHMLKTASICCYIICK